MTENANNPNEPRKLDDAELDEVTGGTLPQPMEFYRLLGNVENPTKILAINTKLKNGAAGDAYLFLYEALRLEGKEDLMQQVKQLYADTYDGSNIPGLS